MYASTFRGPFPRVYNSNPSSFEGKVRGCPPTSPSSNLTTWKSLSETPLSPLSGINLANSRLSILDLQGRCTSGTNFF